MEYKQIQTFMEYMRNEFPGCFDNHFNYDLLTNIIEYIYQNNEKEKAKIIITALIPEITIQEIERYLHND